VSKIKGEGIVVFSDVCLRYRVREMFVWGCESEVQGEGIVVYSDVCLR